MANDKSRLYDVLRIDYVMPALATLFVAGRIFARVLLKVALGPDDWMMLAALSTYLIAVATSLGLVLNGFGQHTFWLTTDQVVTALKVCSSVSSSMVCFAA